MKRKYILPVMMSLVVFTACEDDFNKDHFDGVEDMSRPTNVDKIAYTLTDEDYESMGGDVKTNKYFSSENNPDDFIPNWLAKTYFSVDKGSSANITYRIKKVDGTYRNIPYLALSDDDYSIVHGQGFYAPYLNKNTEGKMYKILNEKIADASVGAYAFVEYQYNENGVPQEMDPPVFQYDFEDLSTGDIEKLDGWFISASGDKWELKEYNKNKYMQFTANYAEAEAEAWLVTPEIKVEDANKKLGWDVTVGYWNADCLEVYIVEDFDGSDISKAAKTNVTADFTIPQNPTNGYGTMASAGVMSLSDYAGKTIRVAYHYVGNKIEKKTTTYQIDNIVVGNDIPIPVNTELRFALYEKNDRGWYVFENSNRAMSIPFADYADMGDAAENSSFSSDVKAVDYLPNYLLKNVDYPMSSDTCTVIYRYYAGSGEYKAYSDKFVYNDSINVWQYTDEVYTETRQYGFDGTQWLYSPNVVIDLPVQKGNTEVALFYQTITDWVKENHPEYVTSYGNNDYYYGGSAYQNNFDFRPSAWKKQGTYNDISDEDLKSMMWERLPESFPHALEVLYASAVPVDGIDVLYTINFGIYGIDESSQTTNWTIQYKVVGPGQFEYVPESLKQVE